jgi:hypothetical protein
LINKGEQQNTDDKIYSVKLEEIKKGCENGKSIDQEKMNGTL